MAEHSLKMTSLSNYISEHEILVLAGQYFHDEYFLPLKRLALLLETRLVEIYSEILFIQL